MVRLQLVCYHGHAWRVTSVVGMRQKWWPSTNKANGELISPPKGLDQVYDGSLELGYSTGVQRHTIAIKKQTITYYRSANRGGVVKCMQLNIYYGTDYDIMCPRQRNYREIISVRKEQVWSQSEHVPRNLILKITIGYRYPHFYT